MMMMIMMMMIMMSLVPVAPFETSALFSAVNNGFRDTADTCVDAGYGEAVPDVGEGDLEKRRGLDYVGNDLDSDSGNLDGINSNFYGGDDHLGSDSDVLNARHQDLDGGVSGLRGSLSI